MRVITYHHEGGGSTLLEKSVSIYQTTRGNMREDGHLCTRHNENIRSHLNLALFVFVVDLCNLLNKRTNLMSPCLSVIGLATLVIIYFS
jgi:hypothetical protein